MGFTVMIIDACIFISWYIARMYTSNTNDLTQSATHQNGHKETHETSNVLPNNQLLHSRHAGGCNLCEYLFYVLGWRRDSVTSVFGWRTFPDLLVICG